jgi:Uncharacterized protein conserved in bacteria
MKELESIELDKPSRSQLKREDQLLQVMAKELVELSPASLAALKLSEQLMDAITSGAAMPSNKGARKRQLKYIAGILRAMEMDVIQERLDVFKIKALMLRVSCIR